VLLVVGGFATGAVAHRNNPEEIYII
jgi:hypothetical protein